MELEGKHLAANSGGRCDLWRHGIGIQHRRARGLANISATYGANFSSVTASNCGGRELARFTRGTGPDDLIRLAIGVVASGALLGRLQGGQIGAVKYSVIFAIARTTVDFTSQQLQLSSSPI